MSLVNTLKMKKKTTKNKINKKINLFRYKKNTTPRQTVEEYKLIWRDGSAKYSIKKHVVMALYQLQNHR